MITLHIQGKYWILKDDGKVVYKNRDREAAIDKYQELIKEKAIKKEISKRSIARIWRI